MSEGDHPDIAESLYNLGIIYKNLTKYDAALPFFARALAIRKVIFDDDHQCVVESLKCVKQTQGELVK